MKTRSVIVEPYNQSVSWGLVRAYRETCTWQEHHAFRNAVLACLRPYGTVGPMGEAPITDDVDGPSARDWPGECSDPVFYVVETYWGEYQRDVLVEVEPDHVDDRCLSSLLETIARFPFRSITLVVAGRSDRERRPSGGCVRIFDRRLMVEGPLFTNCRDLADIVIASKTAMASTKGGE